MTFDVDKYVADVLAASRARVRAESAAAVAQATAKAAPKPEKVAKPERVPRPRKPPARPPSEPQHPVTTLLTRSELLALERLARQAGVTREEMLRWCLQAYAEEVETRREYE
jgi:sRNA-binding protein